MQGLFIGVTILLASANVNLAENPVRHPDCPLNDDPQSPTHLAYPGDCSKFYKCLGGWGYPMQCPVGLHWNDRAKLCDWPDQAKCQLSRILIDFPEQSNDKSRIFDEINLQPILIDDTNEKPIKHKDCPPNDFPGKPIHLPYPNNCTKFYKCSYGYAYPMNCPPGEHFGVEIDRCDWPWKAKCDSNATPPPPPTDPTTAAPPTDPTIAPPTDPTIAPPTDPTLPPITTPEPLPPGISCDNVPHGTLYPHPDSCHKFVQCDYGIGVVKTCPANLHFSPNLLVCEWPEIAGCQVGKKEVILS